MRRSLLVVALSLVAAACQKGEGDACLPGDCRKDLLCEAEKCVSCAHSEGCATEGNCGFDDAKGRCVPRNSDDCRQSEACKTRRECSKNGTVCSTFDPRADHKEGGCPCGCDHSAELVNELRGKERGDALAGARASLATIGEREQLGYVTEAMVEHRVRLRALEADLLAPGEAPYAAPVDPRTLALRARRAHGPAHVGGELAVRSELLVFGATTEIVRGRSKDLQACFRLWLEIENLGASGRTLSRPVLRGTPVAFDTRRWYLEDGDGSAWDGALGPGETKSVLLVGYLDAPLPPGASVSARYDVGDIALEETQTALGRWDAHAATVSE